MTELRPVEQYHTCHQEALQTAATGAIIQSAAVVQVQQLDALERQLIAALKQVWIAQGKHKKVVDLR